MEFLIGFFWGFSGATILFVVAFVIIRQLLSYFGKPIMNTVIRTLNELHDKTSSSTEIIYPDHTKELFDKTETLDEILKV